MRPIRTAFFCALLFATIAPAQQPAPLSRQALTAQVDQVAQRLKAAEDNLVIVEQQYARKRDLSKDELLVSRYSDGELRYLLKDYRGAAIIFYDLVADEHFKRNPKYADALFYLGDALYRTNNAVIAKVYLKALLALQSKHYRDALLRYIDIAGRTNDYTDIDDYIAAARVGPSGELTPELAYTYGKWNFGRKDLPPAERLRRARAVFEPLAAGASNFRLSAAYFLAVAFVEEGNYDQATEQFRRITDQQATTQRDKAVLELSWMSVGRLLYETGKVDEAIDSYQHIHQNSDYFVESLYEVAWVRVKKGDFQGAYYAADILVDVAEDAKLAPEGQILKGNLLAKLKRWQEATDQYEKVINTYLPVEDELKALLSANSDPVAYFDNLLARNERNRNVTELLPPVARKWATTQREVAEAVSMVNDLEVGRRNVQEANEMAARILKALDERGFETFPELQEGYIRADAVDSALTEADAALTRVEGYAAAEAMTPGQTAQLHQLKTEQSLLQGKFQSLPTTEKEVQARKQRMQRTVDAMERDAFKTATQVQSLFAQIAAVEIYANNTANERRNTQEQEREFRQLLDQETEVLNQLLKDLTRARQKLQDERELADAMLGGEQQIRERYSENLKQQQALLSSVGTRRGGDGAFIFGRVADIRARATALKVRVDAAKAQLREQVETRRDAIRAGVNTELKLLNGYGGDVQQYSDDARQLVGRIAFDSFQRVHQQFYDLVLKANVGVVDVAFTRKQDKTVSIQQLSADKDRDLKRLDDEFREVLKDVD